MAKVGHNMSQTTVSVVTDKITAIYFSQPLGQDLNPEPTEYMQ
jgi:hypothetical protein